MEIAICPSQIKTRGSFATISNGKCGLIDCRVRRITENHTFTENHRKPLEKSSL